MANGKIEVKKVEVKQSETKLEDWRLLKEWAINQRGYDVSYHSMEPEVDIWLNNESGYHIRLSSNGTWSIQ